MRFALGALGLVLTSCGPERATRPAPQNPTELVPAGVSSNCGGIPLADVEALARIQAGTRIAIEGVPQVGTVTCTELACSEACCNTCRGGPVYFVSLPAPDGGSVHIDIGLGSCSGNECDLSCEPFGSRPQTPYRFIGEVQPRPGTRAPRFTMRVEAFCATERRTSRTEGTICDIDPGACAQPTNPKRDLTRALHIVPQ